jgi:hypothetical protein
MHKQSYHDLKAYMLTTQLSVGNQRSNHLIYKAVRRTAVQECVLRLSNCSSVRANNRNQANSCKWLGRGIQAAAAPLESPTEHDSFT